MKSETNPYYAARDAAQRSLELLTPTGNRLEIGRSEYELGRILLKQGESAGREHAARAVAIFEELGVEKELERARALLRK